MEEVCFFYFYLFLFFCLWVFVLICDDGIEFVYRVVKKREMKTEEFCARLFLVNEGGGKRICSCRCLRVVYLLGK